VRVVLGVEGTTSKTRVKRVEERREEEKRSTMIFLWWFRRGSEIEKEGGRIDHK